MKYVISRYNQDLSWLKDYTDDYIIYDRSDNAEWFNCPYTTITVPNIGNADYDKLTYIIDNYDSLPDVFALIKCNLFKYISKEEFDEVKSNTKFTPLLTKLHKTYEPICRYNNGIYEEINNSWYVPQFESKFRTYNEWADYMGLPKPDYLKFAPGGNYIVTKECIHKWPKDFYVKMRDTLSYTQLPAEAHFVERTYYTLWS